MKLRAIRTLILFALLLPTAAAANSWSYSEEVNAILYGQSLLVPALLEVCAETFPDEAEMQEKAWKKWQKANRKAVRKGEKAWAKIEKTANPEPELRANAKKEAEKMREENEASRRETCDTILEVLRRES